MFVKGGNGGPGRPKGSRNKLQEDFLKDFCEAWDKHGKEALLQVAMNEPAKFVQVAAGLLPKQEEIEITHRSIMRMPDVAKDAAEWITKSSGNRSPAPKQH